MTQHTQLHLLSTKGSNRATAYVMSNKSITLDGKTHVVWTDAIATTCGRTFDHATQRWSDTVVIGEGCDNHNNPSLTADAAKRLHIVYGPHGSYDHQGLMSDWPSGAFKYSVAAQPNSLDGLEKPWFPFGYHATYGFPLHTPSGVDCLVYRGGEHPPSLMFQRQRPLGGWTNATALLRQDIKPGYTYYGAHIACAGDGTLYVGGGFYSMEKEHSIGVAVLKSTDMGDTWTDLRGQKADVPVPYSARFAVPHAEAKHNPYLSGLEVDRSSALWALSSNNGITDRRVLLSRWEGTGWHTVDVAQFLPDDCVPCGSCAACFVIDTRGHFHVAVQAAKASLVAEVGFHQIWGHPSNAVFHLLSRDGGKTFACRQVSPETPDVFSGLPNISKTGPFHPVERPAILFTRGNLLGIPDEGCRATVKNEVYCVFVEAD